MYSFTIRITKLDNKNMEQKYGLKIWVKCIDIHDTKNRSNVLRFRKT